MARAALDHGDVGLGHQAHHIHSLGADILHPRIRVPVENLERSLQEYGDLISPLDVEEIHADVETLKATLDTVDPEELQLAIKNLEQSAYRIADAMYDATEGAIE